MAWAFTGFRGSANNKVSGALLAVSPNTNVPVGAVLVAVCASDNVVTNGAQTNTHALADAKGNKWQKIREHTNSAAAGAGITLSVWACQITTQINTTDSLGFVLTAAATSKAIGLYEYAVSAGNLLRIVLAASSEQDATSAPTVTVSGLLSQSYALFGVCARENDNAGTYSPDADYNDRQKFGTTGGTGTTNVSCIVGDRLATLTGDTFAPTALSASSDVATILVVLQEVVPVTIVCTNVETINGTIYVTWDDGAQQEFRSLDDAIAMRDELYADGKQILRRMAIARYLRVDPTASNPSIIEGHSIRYSDNIDTMTEVL